MAGASMIDDYVAELSSLLGRHDRDGSAAAEVRSHLHEDVDRRIACGASRREAEAEAVRSFGDARVVARLYRRGGRAGVPTVYSRCGGALLLLGAIAMSIYVFAELAEPRGSQGVYPVLGGGGFVAITVGMVGLHLRQASSAPRTGTVGLVLLLVGTVTSPFGGWGPLGYLPLVPLTLGVLFLVAATVAAGYVPGTTLRIIVLGGALTLVNWTTGGFTRQDGVDAISFVVMFGGIAWMGWLLATEHATTPGHDPLAHV